MTNNSRTIYYNGIEFQEAYPYLNEYILLPLEKFLDINFPKDYREFLLNVNGGYPNKRDFKFINSVEGSTVHFFYGINGMGYEVDFLQQYKYNQSRIPDDMIHIAADCGGNQILLSVKGKNRGSIYFWDHELEGSCSENVILITTSFNEFINMLHEPED